MRSPAPCGDGGGGVGGLQGSDEVRAPDWESNDGAVRLFLGDCRELLAELPAGSVDAVVTDIPYGEVNRESGGLRVLDKGIADIETFTLAFAVDQSARLASTAHIFCGTEQVSELRARFVEAGMTTRLCVWEKSNPSPMNGECFWLSSIEACVFARKPTAYFGEFCQSPVWRGPIEREQVHPTQKPDWLIRRLVRAGCPEHGTVLDFCLGSGTTAVAAIRTNRRCIGVEREPAYFNLAVSRLTAELSRTPLFPDPPAVQRELIQ